MEAEDGLMAETLESPSSVVMSDLAQSNTADIREAGHSTPFHGTHEVTDFTLHLDRRPDVEQTGDHHCEHFQFQNNNAYGVDLGDSGHRSYENILEDI